MLTYYININGSLEKRYVFTWNFLMIKVFLLYLLVPNSYTFMDKSGIKDRGFRIVNHFNIK